MRFSYCERKLNKQREKYRDFKRSGNLLWDFLPRWGKIFSQSVSSIKWKRCSLLFRECYTIWMEKIQFSTSMKNSKRNSKKKKGGSIHSTRSTKFSFFFIHKNSLSLSFFSLSLFLSLNFKRHTRNFLETLPPLNTLESNPIFQSCHASFRNWKRVWNNWTEKEDGPNRPNRRSKNRWGPPLHQDRHNARMYGWLARNGVIAVTSGGFRPRWNISDPLILNCAEFRSCTFVSSSSGEKSGSQVGENWGIEGRQLFLARV